VYEDLFFATSTLFGAPSSEPTCDINAICSTSQKYIKWATIPLLTLRVYLHSFSCYLNCLRNTRNVAKFQENLTLQQFKVIQVIDLGINGKPICDFVLVINCNFSRICYRLRDIHA